MTSLINLTVWLFALDAAFSAAHELAACADQCSTFASTRNSLALIATIACQLLLIAWIITPRVPAILAVVTGTFTAWATLGAPPMALLMTPSVMMKSLALVQVLLAAGLIAFVHRRSGGRWWLGPEDLGHKRASFWRGAGLTVLATVASVALVVLAVPSAILGGIAQATAGYVSFSQDAMMVEQRRFEADDGNISVDLIGMVHFGEHDTYEDLFSDLANQGTVVLTEGVTDEDAVLTGGLSYQGLAQSIGLTQQPAIQEVLDARRPTPAPQALRDEDLLAPDDVDVIDDAPDAPSDSQWPHIRHADVDAREFSPTTIAYLGKLGETLQTRTMDDWLALFSEPPPTTLEHDILTLRNEKLLQTLDGALADYAHIVVPWGALHMPEVEAGLVARGFELVSVERRPIIRYATIFSRLAQNP
ncbi:MAG: hypothetical protein AAF184_11590 [Pseudomonadota bacterium]